MLVFNLVPIPSVSDVRSIKQATQSKEQDQQVSPAEAAASISVEAAA